MYRLLVLGVMSASAAMVWQRPHIVESDRLNLMSFSISPEIPGDYRISQCAYRSGGELVALGEIPAEIANREKEYTWFWLRKAIGTEYRTGRLPSGIRLVSSISGKDDGAFLAYSMDGYSIELVDGRALTMLVRKDGLSECSTLEIFSEFANKDISGNRKRSASILTEQLIGNAESYGRIRVDGANRGWFPKPVEWYRSGDAILFLFTKEMNPGPSKIPTRIARAPLFFGGVADDDPRPFLRFENGNRVELAQEQLAKKIEADKAKAAKKKPADSSEDTAVIKGMPKRRPR